MSEIAPISPGNPSRNVGPRARASLRRLALALWMAIASPHGAEAFETLSPLALASTLIDRGRIEEAAALIEGAPEALDTAFLAGRLALARGDGDAAARLLRGVVEADPSAARPRLELARAYFDAGDDAKAVHHFDVALGLDLPPLVAARASALRERARERKPWRFALSLAARPDTNANAATDAAVVELRGLPFALNDDAKPRSGLALVGRASAGYRLALSPDRRLDAEAAAHVERQSDDALDRARVRFELGPTTRTRNGDDALRAVAERSWSGGDPNAIYAGVELARRRDLSTNVGAFLQAGLGVRRHDRANDREADAIETELAAGTRASLAAIGLLDFETTLRSALARESHESRIGGAATLGIYRELPWTVSIRAEATLGLDHRLADDPSFDRRRSDLFGQARLGMLSRAVDLLGFTPTIAAIAERRSSTLDLYDYDRLRFEIGGTRRF